MIYYLQKISPPILPCLQNVSLNKPDEFPQREEDEMNTWYQEDLDYVKGIFMSYNWRNAKSIGQLFLGFFEFYEKFDFRTQIDISMRERSTVRRVAVEIRDPFDETHDLARVLRLSGENLVRNSFHSALNLFRRVNVLRKNLSAAEKLSLFDWLVDQVANSHPFEKMSSCWLCGDVDHFKSVCHVFAERKMKAKMEYEKEKRKQQDRSKRFPNDNPQNTENRSGKRGTMTF